MLKHLIPSTMLFALTASAAVSPSIFTPRRTGASVAMLVALMGVVIGGRALARTAGERRRAASMAVVLGSLGILGGGLVVATAPGGVGTGNGLGGGVVAVVLGLSGVTLGALALARSRRIA